MSVQGPESLSLRERAARLVSRGAKGRPLAPAIERAAADLSSADRALLSQLVFGTVRWLRRVDHVLESASGRGLDAIDPELVPVLRVAAYQLLFLDRVPAYAAVDEGVRSARARTHRAAAGFVNAVLRRVASRASLDDWPLEIDQPVARLAVEQSVPDALAQRWVDRWGIDRASQVLRASNREKPTHLLAVPRPIAGVGDDLYRETLARSLREEGIAPRLSTLSRHGLIVENGGAVLKSRAFAEGSLYLQDEGAQLAAAWPPVVAGEWVLDAACGPGGKSFALWCEEPELELVSADLTWAALQRFRTNAERLGLGSRIRPVRLDARRPGLAPRFDRVVADLPCSGTGTLRKHPEVKWRPSSVAPRGEPVFEMLAGLAPLVRPGGRLVMITCSLEPEENEDVAARFLAELPQWQVVAEETPRGDEIETLGGGGWRLLPAGDHDGFTVFGFVRSG